QILYELSQSGVQRTIEQMPVETMIVVPFGLLPELKPHEHQLLARVRVHEAVQDAKRRGLLPLVTGNLPPHRSFPVHDLVVRKRKDEVLRKRIQQREREVTMVIAAEDRILAH